MRVTNSMIMRNSMNNINKTKTQVDKLNNQMTTQKKISKASEDPVIAIRSLRLRTSLSEVTQYLDNNISDANSWLESTETAITNMLSVLNDIYEQCDQASNDTLSTSNRSIVLSSLEKLREQIYEEADAETTGRTIFTGYKTNKELAFLTDETDTTYQIKQKFSADDITTKRYYPGKVEVPKVVDTTDLDAITSPDEVTNYRLRLDYDDLSKNNGISIKIKMEGLDDKALVIETGGHSAATGEAITNIAYYELANPDAEPTDSDYLEEKEGAYRDNSVANTNPFYGTTIDSKSYADWEAAGFAVDDMQILFIPDTGEIVMGDTIAKRLKAYDAQINVTYEKTGFEKGELRPEYYYDCTEIKNTGERIEYTKTEQHINYTIANNTSFEVNVEASEFMTADIGRDVDELIQAVQAAKDAEEKVSKLEEMIAASTDDNEKTYLNKLLEAAKKEETYALDNEQKMFGSGLTSFQHYIDRASLAKTTIGNKVSQLTLVKNRMTDQKTNVKTLLSSNEDEKLSDIVINYTAAYNTYESALGAVSKATSTTLLDYLR